MMLRARHRFPAGAAVRLAAVCLLAGPARCLAGIDLATGVYRSGSAELDLSYPGLHADLIDDPTATGGRCARATSRPAGAWFIQWPWDSRQVVPGLTYQPVARVRIDPAPPETPGTACRVGLYDRFAGKRVGEVVTATVADLADGGWHEVVLPPFVAGEAALCLYVATGDAGERVPWLYVDDCRLEPLAAGREAELRAGLETIGRRLAEDEAFVAGYRPRPAPEVARFFPFGVTLTSSEAHLTGELCSAPWQRVWRARLDDVRDHGCNLAFDLSADAHTPYLEEVLRVAQAEGVTIVSGQSHVIRGSNRSPRTTIDEAAVRAQFQALVPRLVDLDRFLFWYLVDEPRLDQCTGFLRGKQVIESCDPARLALPLMNTPETIARLGPSQQVLLTDRYPMYRDGADPWCVKEWVEMAREHAAGPVWMMLPAYSSKGMRMTQPAEARLMVYRALAGGAQGIVFYCHSVWPYWEKPFHPETLSDPFGTGHPTWEVLADEARRLVPLGPVLTGCRPSEATGVDVACGTVSGFRRELPAVTVGAFEHRERLGLRLLVVGNNDPERETAARVTLDGVVAALDTASLSRMTLPWACRLAPGEGRVLAVGSERDLAWVAATVEAGRWSQERAAAESLRVTAAARGLDLRGYREAERLAEQGLPAAAVEALRRTEAELLAEPGLAAGLAELARLRREASARHRSLTVAKEAGDEAAVAAGRDELLAAGRAYFARWARQLPEP